MFTVFCALVAITIAIVNAQTYDDCGSATISVGGTDQTMKLERDSENTMVRITLTGPNDKWFGFVIGQGIMSGYAITGQGAATYELSERTLEQHQPLSVLGSSGTPTAVNSGSNGVLTLVRPYSFGTAGYFDFTELMTCNTASIAIAGAQGSSLDWAKHTATERDQTFTRTCQCASATAAPSVAPTEADDFQMCAESELIDNVALTLYRDTENKKVRIQISGQNTAWFGYGFGSAQMIGIIHIICYLNT